jgi:hypothetical protein
MVGLAMRHRWRRRDQPATAWVVFADLFAGLLLFTIMGLTLLPKPPVDVRFTKELAKAMNTATIVIALLREQLDVTLETRLRATLSFGETQISIPSGALFRSFGYDDFLDDPEKRQFLIELRVAIKNALDNVGASRRFVRIIIEGHTDSDPILPAAKTSAIPTNWELSARRATGVLRFFGEGGLDAGAYNIIAVGRADTYKVTTEATSSDKAANRRIVIRIEPDIDAIRASLAEPSAQTTAR